MHRVRVTIPAPAWVPQSEPWIFIADAGNRLSDGSVLVVTPTGHLMGVSPDWIEDFSE